MQTIDNQPPVLYLAIKLWSKDLDLKHLIPIPVNPDDRISIQLDPQVQQEALTVGAVLTKRQAFEVVSLSNPFCLISQNMLQISFALKFSCYLL